MKKDIDKIMPIVGKRSRLNQRVILFVFTAIILIVAVAVWIFLNPKKMGYNFGESKLGLEQKSNEGRVLEIWGTVTKITEIKNSIQLNDRKKAVTADDAILTVQSDTGKEYQVSVNEATKISRNEVAEPNDLEEQLEVNVNYAEIKNGDRIYLTSLVDLNREAVVSAVNVVSIKWFETVVPK